MVTTNKCYSETVDIYIYIYIYIYKHTNDTDGSLTLNHYIIRDSRILTIDKLTSRYLYSYLILTIKLNLLICTLGISF